VWVHAGCCDVVGDTTTHWCEYVARGVLCCTRGAVMSLGTPLLTCVSMLHAGGCDVVGDTTTHWCECFARGVLHGGCGGRGELVAFACADTGAASWLHSRGALRCTGCEAMRCNARDALREPMRCELVAVACADTGTASWLQLHAQIQARRAGCSCMRRYRRGELVAVACADTGAASWLQLHAQIQAQRAGCSCMRRYRHHAFDGGIFRVGGEGLRYGLIGGQREKVRGGCMGLSSRAEGREKVRGEYIGL
jgi:hypothetical protein